MIRTLKINMEFLYYCTYKHSLAEINILKMHTLKTCDGATQNLIFAIYRKYANADFPVSNVGERWFSDCFARLAQQSVLWQFWSSANISLPQTNTRAAAVVSVSHALFCEFNAHQSISDVVVAKTYNRNKHKLSL